MQADGDPVSAAGNPEPIIAKLLAGADPPDCERTCLDCHTSPHSLPFVTAVAALADVPDARRTARYRCVMVFLRGEIDSSPVIASGHWEGWIARQPRGAHGFGYDPLFVTDSTGTSAAELAPDVKNRVSHRGIALRALIAELTAGIERKA